MPLNLFAPPATNWYLERRRREAESAGPYERAVALTNRDAATAARANALPGRGAAATRDAMQATAPEIARLRAEQANAAINAREGARTDMRAEIAAQNDFQNQLLGGVAGILGQAAVPLISGLGSGGAPAVGAPAAPPVAMAGPAMPGAPAAATAPLMGADPHGYANGGLYPLSEEERLRREEERRRREAAGGGLGGLMGAAAPIAGMVNPLAGLALGAGRSLFG